MTNLMQTRSVERPTTEEKDLKKSRKNLARRKIKVALNTLQSKKKMILKKLRRKQERG